MRVLRAGHLNRRATWVSSTLRSETPAACSAGVFLMFRLARALPCGRFWHRRAAWVSPTLRNQPPPRTHDGWSPQGGSVAGVVGGRCRYGGVRCVYRVCTRCVRVSHTDFGAGQARACRPPDRASPACGACEFARRSGLSWTDLSLTRAHDFRIADTHFQRWPVVHDIGTKFRKNRRLWRISGENIAIRTNLRQCPAR